MPAVLALPPAVLLPPAPGVAALVVSLGVELQAAKLMVNTQSPACVR
jgi:hypothetical protein